VEFLTSGRIKHAPVKQLPQVFDAERVLADEHLRALLDDILEAPFANAHQATVGFDFHNATRLIE
jgi:hypothetical protein